MTTRGLRGAIVADGNNPQAILHATKTLLLSLLETNPDLETEDIASIFFTVTTDLNATYPAMAAREMGWVQVPMLCAQEIPVPDGMSSCIRVLLHWNTPLPQENMHHVYLGAAKGLRPDIAVTNSGL